MTQRTSHRTDSFPWFPLTTVALTGVLWVLHLALRDRYEPGDPTRLALTATLVATFAIGYFGGEGMLQGADSRDLPTVMLLADGIGRLIAWRRYR